MTEPIHRLGREMAHFHLCESNGGPPGSGHLDFPAIFEALNAVGYTGFTSVKAYRLPWAAGAESSIQYLQQLPGGSSP